MTQPASSRSDGRPKRRKATLFCWECDHSSPIDGDWRLQSQDGDVAYVCPACETTLVKRPRRHDPTPDRTPAPFLTAWQRAFRSSATLWRASITVGYTNLNAAIGARSWVGS
ncbi:hypothetical protein [Natrinema ejinorense]|uniref:DUF8106 domain-containing protein n=1 Tax=Natrinema ejinorense TaxID=373386 RepID=A0A2A5QVS4_9EURY|nr:hypothetical protein [Natrinema ejinorense]PCR90951.1 hypothetical protein CP557_10705 [Natrinema ejinorense]